MYLGHINILRCENDVNSGKLSTIMLRGRRSNFIRSTITWLKTKHGREALRRMIQTMRHFLKEHRVPDRQKINVKTWMYPITTHCRALGLHVFFLRRVTTRKFCLELSRIKDDGYCSN